VSLRGHVARALGCCALLSTAGCWAGYRLTAGPTLDTEGAAGVQVSLGGTLGVALNRKTWVNAVGAGAIVSGGTGSSGFAMVAGPTVAAVPTKKSPWGASALLGGGTRNYFEPRYSAQPATIVMNVSALRALHEGSQEFLSFGMEGFGAYTWDRHGAQPGLFGLGVSLIRDLHTAGDDSPPAPPAPPEDEAPEAQATR
jgi:hypothetical protein